MNEPKTKIPSKGSGKRLRDFYEKNRERSKGSDSLVEGLKEPAKDQPKKSAIKPDLEA